MTSVLERQFETLQEMAGNILASSDPEAIREWGREFKKFSGAIETTMSSSGGWSKSPSVNFSVGPRLRELMIRLLPHIQKFISNSPPNTVFDVLDVESGFGHGTDLLASMYLTNALGYRLRVAACCADQKRFLYLSSMFRTFVSVPRPLEGIRRHYDLVVSPFGAQRQPNVRKYLDTLQATAIQRVFVLAPYAEPPNRLAAGHRSVIDDDLLKDAGAENVELSESPAWGRAEHMKVVQFQLPGQAEPGKE